MTINKSEKLRSQIRRASCFISILVLCCSLESATGPAWTGVLRDETGVPVANVKISLRESTGDTEYQATTGANGVFAFGEIKAGSYRVSVTDAGRQWTATELVAVAEGQQFRADSVTDQSSRPRCRARAFRAPPKSMRTARPLARDRESFGDRSMSGICT